MGGREYLAQEEQLEGSTGFNAGGALWSPACALAAVPPILYVIAVIKFCQGLLKVNEPPINVDGGLVYERERGAPAVVVLGGQPKPLSSLER